MVSKSFIQHDRHRDKGHSIERKEMISNYFQLTKGYNKGFRNVFSGLIKVGRLVDIIY